MSKRKWALISCVLVGMFVLLTLSCGGGGGSSSGGTTGPSQTPATMDDVTAAKTIGLAMVAGNMSDSTDSVVGIFDSTAVGSAGFGGINIVKPVLDIILHPNDGYQSLGSDTNTEGCMTISMTWDGDNDYDDCDEISNVRGSIIFNNCNIEDSISIDGKITFTSSGSSCHPTVIKVTYADFDVTNSEEGIHVWTDSFTIEMKDFDYSGDEISGATMVLNGTINAVLDGENYTVSCSDYTITMAVAGETVSMTISGMINGPCLDGWVTVQTIDPIIVKEGYDCPTGGKIKLIGDGEVTVIFNSNGSVDVGSDHYDSCDQLNQGCQ